MEVDTIAVTALARLPIITPMISGSLFGYSCDTALHKKYCLHPQSVSAEIDQDADGIAGLPSIETISMG